MQGDIILVVYIKLLEMSSLNSSFIVFILNTYCQIHQYIILISLILIDQ